jgi:hypothetical protein
MYIGKNIFVNLAIYWITDCTSRGGERASDLSASWIKTNAVEPLLYTFQGSDEKWCKLRESVNSRKCINFLFQRLLVLNLENHVDEL